MSELLDLDRALRRIAQLEAALMRRNELLEQKQAALCAILESDAWKFVKFAHRVRDRLLPLRSRRRELFKRTLKTTLKVVRWALGEGYRDTLMRSWVYRNAGFLLLRSAFANRRLTQWF